MTSKTRISLGAVIAGLALLLAACAGSPAPQDTSTVDTAPFVDGSCSGDEGVTVVVDAASLEDSPESTVCVLSEETIGAADALELAGITTEGTTEYPDMVVCRVDGIPAEDTALTADDGTVVHEKCESMPAAFAYWSLWVKPAGGEWEYAQEGLSTLQLEPGESFALLFSLNGEPASP